MTDYSSIAAMALPLVAGAETGGQANPNTAANPNSSATGLLQFTDPTWAGMAKNYPSDGYAPDNKNDPAMQKKAWMRLATSEYAPAIEQAGAEVNPQSLYLMHFLGTPNGKKLLGADKTAKASDVLGSAWSGIQGANRGLIPDTGATVGDVMNSVGARVGGQMPPEQGEDAQQQPSDPAAPITLQGDPQQAPQAPTIAPVQDPNANQSWLDRLVGGLGAWGAGANGQDFAAGLGQGAGNVMQYNQQNRKASEDAEARNRDIAQLNFENKVKSAQAGDALQEANARRATALADLLKKNPGLPISTATAILDRQSGTFDGIDPVQAAAAQKAKNTQNDRFTGGETWVAPDPKNPDQDQYFTRTTNSRDGQGQFRNDATGEITDHVPGAVPSSSIDPKGVADLSMKAYQTDAEGRSAMAKNTDLMDQILPLLPAIATGGSVSARVKRELSTLTGKNVGSDLDAQQAAGMLFNQARVGALQAVHTTGRLDAPGQKMALSSGVAMEQNPAVVYHTRQQIGRTIQREQGYANDWDELPANSPWKSRRGWSAYVAHRRASEPDPDPKAAKQQFDQDIADYHANYDKLSQSLMAPDSATSPTGNPAAAPQSPTSRVGPSGGQGQWKPLAIPGLDGVQILQQ